MKGTVYLHDIPLSQAWQALNDRLKQAGLDRPLEAEEVDLDHALGRVTAEPVWASMSSPAFHCAAMDGYAVRATDTTSASDRTPVSLPVGPQAQYVDTGDALPEWADAVIPIENIESETADPRPRTGKIRIRHAIVPWAHVRPLGEDLVATELVLPAGHTLRPVDLGAMAASGHSRVVVWRRPRVAILPTGSELVPVGVRPLAGQIPEFNSIVLAAQVETWGGIPYRFPIVVDDLQALRTRLSEAAAEHDLVLINAGSSAGSEDFSAQSIADLGEVLVHGVAVRPGHPVILGMIRRPPPSGGSARQDWVPVIGVPGFPVSAALTGEIFVEPLLALWLGIPRHQPATLEAVLTRKIHSSAGDDEYVRVTVGKVGPRWVASPLSRGAGVLSSLVRADGLVVIPAGVQGHAAGEQVAVRLYRNPAELERTIIALGSHDLTLDLLAQYLSARGRRLSSANLGSIGGLIALRRGEAHIAGSHLLDAETGTYNIPYLPQYLPETRVTVVALVERDQGLLLAKGNPKGVQHLQDLARADIRFVNRQRGAGTRVLLDFELGKLGLSPERVNGYEQEEFTHLAVAAAISSGRADCGLGIRAAAAALDLDFLPIARERYDLVIPDEHFSSELLRPLRELLHDSGFRNAVGRLPGYHVAVMGEVMSSTAQRASDVHRPSQGRT